MCFIGSGLSCSYTLIHFIEELKNSPLRSKVKICVIDKTNELWTGIPYGNRSGENSLIITSLKEFLPEEERKNFINWLKINTNRFFKNDTAKPNDFSTDWISNNKALVTEDNWEKLYLPRYIFGAFLKEKINGLIKFAEQNGLVQCEVISAEVTDVHKQNNSFEIVATPSTGDELCIVSKQVVLSIGSPPKKNVTLSGKSSSEYICIQDMYEPELKENINKINRFLNLTKESERKNILILGSNASSLEIIYNLQKREASSSPVNKFYILSPDGIFPHRINEDFISPDYAPLNLISLKNSKNNTCRKILEAVKKDIAIANNKKIPIADIYEPISHAMIELVNALNLHQQKQFVDKYGVEIGKLQRRAGAEYLNIIDKLVYENRIEFVKGKFLKQVQTKDNYFLFKYKDSSAGEEKVFPTPVNIIINCIGAADLKKSNSALIQNLIRRKICVVNGSNKGFTVNENFESITNFFVIGPLLSGTLNKKLRIWHAESCPRIFFLSQQLAGYLLNNIKLMETQSS